MHKEHKLHVGHPVPDIPHIISVTNEKKKMSVIPWVPDMEGKAMIVSWMPGSIYDTDEARFFYIFRYFILR